MILPSLRHENVQNYWTANALKSEEMCLTPFLSRRRCRNYDQVCHGYWSTFLILETRDVCVLLFAWMSSSSLHCKLFVLSFVRTNLCGRDFRILSVFCYPRLASLIRVSIAYSCQETIGLLHSWIEVLELFRSSLQFLSSWSRTELLELASSFCSKSKESVLASPSWIIEEIVLSRTILHKIHWLLQSVCDEFPKLVDVTSWVGLWFIVSLTFHVSKARQEVVFSPSSNFNALENDWEERPRSENMSFQTMSQLHWLLYWKRGVFPPTHFYP